MTDTPVDSADVVPDGVPSPGRVVRFDPDASREIVTRHAVRTPVTSPGARRAEAGGQAPEATPAPPTDDEVPAGYATVPYTAVRLSPRRRAIAEHMTRSRATSAHASVETEIDLGHLAATRDEVNATLPPTSRPLSYLPFVARATVAALRAYPDLNASVVGDRLLRWHPVHLGIAVDTQSGLVAPVIRDADELTAVAIGERIRAAAQRARTNNIAVDEMRSGTFTVSNVGSAGSVIGSPVINQPQVAILVIGAAVRRPWVRRTPEGDEGVAIRPIMRANLTFDHRVVDGAQAGRCLDSIREYLETSTSVAYT